MVCVKTPREFPGTELVFRKAEDLLFVIFCLREASRTNSSRGHPVPCQGPPWTLLCFLSFCTEPYIAASLAHGRPHPDCLGLFAGWGRLAVFSLCFQESKALRSREVDEGLDSPGARSPFCKVRLFLALQWSGSKQ